MKLLCFVLALLNSLVSFAAEIPALLVPEGVGVNIHFVTGHEKDLELIQAAGFKFIRMDFAWTGTERQKGKYDWHDYEQLLVNLDERALRALFILDYSNPLYEEAVTSQNPISHQEHKTTASPQHPESVAAFARWAAAAAKHFQGRHIVWEIWNEPNIQFWAPKPDAEQYTALALATCKAVREAEPKATVIGPASSGFPWEFLETFLKSGVLEYLDGVSVHPYRDKNSQPETAAGDYTRLRELIARYAPARKKESIPVLSGEWGYSSHKKGVSLETQAAFAVRQQLANLLQGIPLSIWYDWKNDGEDPGENEHNFGTVQPDLKPKPAYLAIQTFTRELNGCRFDYQVSVEGGKDYVLVFVDSTGSRKLAAWTTTQPHPIRLAVADGKVISTKEEALAQGKVPALTLTAAPQYLDLRAGLLHSK